MTSYYMLMTSLPRHNKQYKIKQTPISRIQLEKRLKLLTESERNILTSITYCIWDSWFDPKLPLNETIKKSKMLLLLKNPFIENMIYWFFDIRSVFVALRLRKIQSFTPANPKDLWFTCLSTRLIKNWNIPDFGLKSVYPWLAEISNKMSSKETATVEDIFLTLIWKHLDSIETRHFYDFEALIIYLMRWKIVDYWSSFNEKIASDRVHELTDKILADSHIETGNPGQNINESVQNKGVFNE